MAQIKTGRQSIDTKNIAMIADTYAIINQHGKDASSFVLTHEPANEFAKKVIAADPSAALVSTGLNGRGNFLNIDYIRDVQDHSVEMNFGTKEVDANVPTELTKDEMQRQMNHVSDFVLQGMAKHDRAFGFKPTPERERPSRFLDPVETGIQADRSQMLSSELSGKNDVPFMTLRSSKDSYVVSNAAADRLSKTNPDIIANSKILDDEKLDVLNKDLDDPVQLRSKESSRKLPDVPTGNSGIDDGMDFDG